MICKRFYCRSELTGEVDGSMSILLMTGRRAFARDRYGRTPVVIGCKEDAYVYPLKALPILIWDTRIIKS